MYLYSSHKARVLFYKFLFFTHAHPIFILFYLLYFFCLGEAKEGKKERGFEIKLIN